MSIIWRMVRVGALICGLLAFPSALSSQDGPGLESVESGPSLAIHDVEYPSETLPGGEADCRSDEPCRRQPLANIIRGGEHFVVGRGAGTYYSVPGETEFGGAYGLQLGLHLSGKWGFLGSFDVNHLSNGTQFSGTTGFLKLSDPCGTNWRERSTFLATLDQFGDSRIDGMYLNQLRFLWGYSLNECLHLGVTFAQPLNEAQVTVRFRAFPAFPFRGSIEMSQAASVYAAWQYGSLQLTGSLGYRDTFDELTLGTGFRFLHSDRVSSFVAFGYGADRATWGGSAGFQVKFGPRSCGSTYGASEVCATSSGSAIVRAQSPPTVQVASVPGPTTEEADTIDSYSAERFRAGEPTFDIPIQDGVWDVFLDPQYNLFAPIQNVADIPLEFRQNLPNGVLQNPGFRPFIPRTNLIPIVR